MLTIRPPHLPDLVPASRRPPPHDPRTPTPFPAPAPSPASSPAHEIGARPAASHVIFALQETRRFKVVSIDNHHNSSPKALERVAQLARDALPADASPADRDSAEIDVFACDLTRRDEVRKVFEKYGKGGIWGVVHVAVRPLSFFLPLRRG